MQKARKPVTYAWMLTNMCPGIRSQYTKNLGKMQAALPEILVPEYMLFTMLITFSGRY